jgi:hypothetical protein
MSKAKIKKHNKRAKKNSKITHTTNENGVTENIKITVENDKPNDSIPTKKSQQNNESKKTENVSKNTEKKIIEQSFVSIKFHAFIAPEFEVDINEHENSFGIASDYDWDNIIPLKIQ